MRPGEVEQDILDKIELPRVRKELVAWAGRWKIGLATEDWTARGFTSAMLIGVTEYPAGQQEAGLILKIDPGGDLKHREVAAHGHAVRKNPDFAKRHLAEVRYQPVAMDEGGYIAFQTVAGGGFDVLLGFGEMLRAHAHADRGCRAIARSLLSEWNLGTAATTRQTAGELLTELLGWRLAPGQTIHTWASRHPGLLESPRPWLNQGSRGLVNPFALARDASVGGTLSLLPVRGLTHGDLHPGNLLVGTDENAGPEFFLVDLSRFTPDGPLTWDPAYLICTTAVTCLIEDPGLDPDKVLDVVLAPEIDAARMAAAGPQLARAIAGIHAGEIEYATEHGLLRKWRQQRLVCLTAIGLILSGRGRIPAPIRRWCFLLAAHAATRLLEGRYRPAAQGFVELPPDFIPDVVAETVPVPPRPSRTGPGLVNHDPIRMALRQRLTAGPPGVVVVTGPRGVGKSALVGDVIAEVAGGPGGTSGPARRVVAGGGPEVRVVAGGGPEVRVVAGGRLDVRTLIDAIEGGPAAALRPGESSLARLEAALETAGDRRVVLVADDAERLLLPNSSVLADLELDEALESLAIRPGHRVTVVLVTSVVPVSPAGGIWPALEPPVAIGRLSPEHFTTLLNRRPHGLDADDLARLYQAVQGNPRATELFQAVRALTGPDVSSRALLDELAGIPPRDVPAQLLEVVLDHLGTVPRRVLECLAAYRFPVTGEQVATLMPGVAEDQVHAALGQLVESSLVSRAGDRHELRPADAAWLIGRLPAGESRRRLLLLAANELNTMSPEEITMPGDLDTHFAELRALIDAPHPGPAYELLEEIDHYLHRWHSDVVLLDYRRSLRGTLPDERSELANDNALGWIYAARGRFGEAAEAYRAALDRAVRLGEERAATRVRANLGAMYWQSNDIEKAREAYDQALRDAMRLDDVVAGMGAWEGLADCHRRRGEYRAAIDQAGRARELAGRPGFPAELTAQQVAARGTRLAFKIARWSAELGQWDRAARVMAEVTAGADESLRAAWLDARADQLLWAGDPRGARELAAEAVALALEERVPVVLMQARTTLCLVHLLADEVDDAAREIEAAERYRSRGRSLEVLAVLALVARRQRRHTLARGRFHRLAEEAEQRIGNDPGDFSARPFRGFALCAGVLDGTAGIEEAVAAFESVRGKAGLAAWLLLLVRQLDDCGRPAGQLSRVVALLTEIAATADPRQG
ncbi:tetratricopeptide repeat protein [Actinoplanes oblitus]|uniref:Tetratricopeptide repeat protein n=1 Tax=Actinoplanes oblitus TaxID=3040509 RepID=A0ABY8W7W5_9ACTN|nr:tetratricopeptide repeat protein [Actinoplanes oblitus]WIM93138.1 tetratricopeptide repeat protein [Actinoplanes oblitus]